MTLLMSFALALFLATVLMPLVVRLAPHMGLLDQPTEARKMHAQAIPRVGGIAIFLGCAFALLIDYPAAEQYFVFFATATAVVLLGLLDDIFDLHFSLKFAGQFIAAISFVYGVGGFIQLPFLGLDPAPAWIAAVLSVVFIVAITNAVNLSDGLDGLAAGNSLLSLVLLSLLALQALDANTAILGITLAGGLVGFLRSNTHPARAFMGDSGSQFIGYSVACITIIILRNESSAFSPVLPLLILGLPILDTVSVMGVRFVRKRPIFRADKSHIHHQLLQMGFKHYEVVFILYGLQLTLVALAYYLRFAEDLVLVVSYLVFCTIVLGAVLQGRINNWTVRKHDGLETNGNKRNLWIRKIGWLYPHSDTLVASCLAVFFVGGALVLNKNWFDVNQFGLATTTGLLTFWILFRDKYEWATRIIVVVGCVFVLAGFLMNENLEPQISQMLNVYLLVLALLLVLAIRITRKEHFRLDNQDFLVLGLMLVVPRLPVGGIDTDLLSRGVLSFAVLLYAVEFLLGRATKPRRWLNYASLFSILLVGSSLEFL